MPENFALFGLLVLAIGIGYLLGRREARRAKSRRRRSTLSSEYFKGLNYVLNEQHGLAIDTFIEAMAVNDETVATHLALGSLVRRQGEVDKAIRIHQNVLAKPTLNAANRTRTELELARDYLLAGLLDRAELLLQTLVERKGSTRQAALEHLMEIYQRERDWQNALDTGVKLLTRQNLEVKGMLAHFLCELAEADIRKGDFVRARRRLQLAENYDPSCARVHLIWAQVEFDSHHYRDTLKHLKRVTSLDSGLISESLPLYRKASLELGQNDGYRRYLEATVKETAAVDVSREYFQQLTREEGLEAAREFLERQMESCPTLEFLDLYLDALLQQGQNGPTLSDLENARRLLQPHLSSQANYRCENCGFASSTQLWQCPSCRGWGKIHRQQFSAIAAIH